MRRLRRIIRQVLPVLTLVLAALSDYAPPSGNKPPEA